MPALGRASAQHSGTGAARERRSRPSTTTHGRSREPSSQTMCDARPPCAALALVHAGQVAPAAHRREVFVLVAPARGSERQMVGRHIAAAAHRARAAIPIAEVDAAIRHLLAQQVLPRPPHTAAEKVQPAHAPRQMPQRPRLQRPPPGALLQRHPQPQHHASEWPAPCNTQPSRPGEQPGLQSAMHVNGVALR
jgi:hypothetical protein